MSKAKLSLSTFIKEAKREACPVCKLPPAIRKQIVERQSEVNLATCAAWLLKTERVRVTEKQLQGHFRSGHERGRWSGRDGKTTGGGK